MRELEQFVNTEAEWALERLSASPLDSEDRLYYQGRLDTAVQMRRFLKLPQIIKEGASK